jgi:lipopolysaccharide export system permease protein
MEAGVSIGIIFSFFFFKTPYIIVQMMPVATMISVIMVLCIMKKNNELVALRACGLDELRFSQSIIIISLLISIFSFLLSELIVPYASSKSNEIWDIEVNKQDPTRFYGSNQIWYKSSDAIYWIKHFDSTGKIIQDPTFFFFDKAFRLTKRIEGKRGIWENGTWRIEEGIVQSLHEDGDYIFSKFKDLFLEIPETPDTFMRKIKDPEDMSYQQLKRHAETVGNEGYDNTGHLVDLNIKLAFPFISLVLAIVGIPVALKLKRGGMPLAITIGVGLCFLYMLIIGFSKALGLSGSLPPILSAWTANLIFILFGVYLMMDLER